MTGRRLLDAAIIFNAARGVANKHVALRTHQLDIYSKTSSLAKAVRSQTDRVTLTLKAASALSERFNGPGHQYSTQASGSGSPEGDPSEPTQHGSKQRNQEGHQKQGLEQDHFYKKSGENTTAAPPPEGSLDIKQETASRKPLPAGSIPPIGAESDVPKQQDPFYETPNTEPLRVLEEEQEKPHDNVRPTSAGSLGTEQSGSAPNGLSVDKAKMLQRQAERQIPTQAAESPSESALRPESQSPPQPETRSPRPNIIQEQESFYTPSSSSEPVLSNLPRTKIPKITKDIQGSDNHVPDDNINQDVFYSQDHRNEQQMVPEAQAAPDQEQLPEEAYSEIFQSPRVAKMLRGQPRKDNSTKGLELPGAGNVPIKDTKEPQQSDEVSSSARVPSKDGKRGSQSSNQDVKAINSGSQGGDDVHDLAADIAKDADKITKYGAETQTDLNGGSSKAPFQMRESRVPSSRFGRIWQYGGLAASMTMGAVGETIRRTTGGSSNIKSGSLMLSAGNMERLVGKLSRMRGAALKLGQMMSFQDSKMLPGPINEVLQRVQDSADYMPPSQRNKVLASNLGADWRDLFSSFDEKPIAAASIGQVHSAVLKTSGQRVAIKVQYPGVANSIDSDLSNLSILLTASRLLPKGLYLDKTIANLRTELAWECDYVREAEMSLRFRDLLASESTTFHVPAIIPEASGPQVLTAEFCPGTAVTKIQTCTQEQKDWIGSNILRLCLREITEFKFMQTDPNWTNFLYNAPLHRLELLDFGASRAYPDAFILPYIRTLLAASRCDRAAVREHSIQLGYLTGHESKAMLNAHVDSVLTLAEPFMETADEVYDFRGQTITERVRGLIPVMVRERLAPPPEETYSLHRKLSGAFLLCARLGSRVRCREMFGRAMEKAGVV